MNDQQSTRVLRSESYGTIEVTTEQIYSFPRGIVGIPDIHDYALIQIEGAPYYVLHALDKELSFILLPANEAVEDYGFKIDQATIDLLSITKPEEVMTLLIVNIIEDDLFVNLKAPILLTSSVNRGCQFIVDDVNLPLRYPLTRKGDE